MRFLKLIAILLCVLAQACAGTQPVVRDVAFSPQISAGVQSWMKGESPQSLDWESDARAAFVHAEVLYHQGDMEGAFDAYARTLSTDVRSEAARYAAARLYTMRDSVAEFSARIMPTVSDLNVSNVAPLTRLYLNMIYQAASFRLWDQSMDYAPFDAASVNFPKMWSVSPLLSPWRIYDWDTQFAPETEPRLADTYLSPLMATESPENREDTEHYVANGLNLAPSFGADGIYYLETFFETQRPIDAWVYTNFAGAGQVWIDGAEIVNYPDRGYTSGKHLTRVELEKGWHRVLVKIGVQRGYRDWFDFQILPEQARLGEVKLDFRSGCVQARIMPECFSGEANAKTRVADEGQKAWAFEPVWVSPEAVSGANDITLYLTLLGAHFSAETRAFDAAWDELMKRHPAFAAAELLKSLQVQTRWELPSRLRDANAMQHLRRAHDLQPDNALYAYLLGARLNSKSQDREVRELLEKAYNGAKEGGLKNLNAITTWASYLEGQGYQENSEAVWREALALAPENCDVARKVQTLEQSRQVFREPVEITPFHTSCPALLEAWINAKPELAEQNLDMIEKYASRFPYRDESQRRWADELWKLGQEDKARAVVEDALKRMPDSPVLWNWKIDRAYAEKGLDEALKEIDTYLNTHGSLGWLMWKRATLSGEVPLLDTMPNGYEAAMKAVQDSAGASLSNDDAYYVVDYAAREYLPDGASLTLTHTVVRVMTKNAIDRYAETSVPSDAYLLQIRTIKENGDTLVPDDDSGKEAISMPGLAEGDFVEVAYLQYSGAPFPGSHRQGVKFYFKMKDISTLHSEYVVWGDAGELIQKNNAPKVERVERQGKTGMRFLAENNPRPRQEPYSVPIDEFLPWIQTWRHALSVDPVETSRRSTFERIHDSLRLSAALESQFDSWLAEVGEDVKTAEGARALFYKAAAWIPDPSAGQFGTEAAHALLTREGSAHIVYKALLDYAGIPAEIYLGRSGLANPEPDPINEFGKFSIPLVRVQVDDQTFWTSPDGPDASWNALGPVVQGQPAICVTCKMASTETVPEAAPLKSFVQNIHVKGSVDEQGNLNGEIEITLPGNAALSFRQGLRSRKDAENRDKLMGSLAANIVPGSVVTGYEILNETAPEADLVIRITLVRQGFARVVPGGLMVETRIFPEALATYYGALPQRTTPMIVGYNRYTNQTLELSFPASPVVLSSGMEGKSQFGDYERRVEVEGNAVKLVANIAMPVQRVSIQDYPAFQKWVSKIDETSVLKVATQAVSSVQGR